MYKHILVPVDLADVTASEKALGAAKHAARRDGARITVITVVPAWPDEGSLAPQDFEPEFNAYLDAVREDLDIDGIFRFGGSISGRIVEAVLDHEIDLVVMASHNPRITDYLIGSNAAHVVLHCPCSVLVVR